MQPASQTNTLERGSKLRIWFMRERERTTSLPVGIKGRKRRREGEILIAFDSYRWRLGPRASCAGTGQVEIEERREGGREGGLDSCPRN